VTRARPVACLAALALALSLFAAKPAHAHTNANLGDFYQGLLQPVFHPEFLLGALAIALWSTQQQGRVTLAICAGFAAGVAIGDAAALFGVGGEGSTWGPRLCMLVVGPMVAARVRMPRPASAALATVAGLAQGHAATAGEIAQIAQPVLWTLGLTLGAVLFGAYANAATERFRAFWLEVGVRVAGSWIAAIGLLASVMAARGR
jgi:hydrogenase/urease accessory protein HupE